MSTDSLIINTVQPTMEEVSSRTTLSEVISVDLYESADQLEDLWKFTGQISTAPPGDAEVIGRSTTAQADDEDDAMLLAFVLDTAVVAPECLDPLTRYEGVAPIIDDVDRGRRIIAGELGPEDGGFYYVRAGEATTEVLLAKFKACQHASHGVATATGQAAALLVAWTLMKGRIVSNQQPILVYGPSTYYEIDILFQQASTILGWRLVKVAPRNLNAWLRGLSVADRESVRLVWVETPENPFCGVHDIADLARTVRRLAPQARLAIDSTVLPLFQKPLDHGADLEVLSLTKYPSQGLATGGAILTADAALARALRKTACLHGSILCPLAASLILERFDGLADRIRSHCSSALELARRLRHHPAVRRVWYPNPRSGLVATQMSGLGGGIAGLELKGGDAAGDLLMSVLADRAGAGVPPVIRCTFGMPTTHLEHYRTFLRERKEIPRERTSERAISPGFCRLAVGLEPVDDIWAGLTSALAGIPSRRSSRHALFAPQRAIPTPMPGQP
jgi:cystathionine beta-lyase/cystathionine gamma-synthase